MVEFSHRGIFQIIAVIDNNVITGSITEFEGLFSKFSLNHSNILEFLNLLCVMILVERNRTIFPSSKN